MATNSSSVPDHESISTEEQKKIDEKYFDSYNDLEVHRLMVNDTPRTQAYRDAIMKNAHLFKDKVVMDVGAGSGILSLFAASAGAQIVHAVEASPMAKLIASIAAANNLQHKIKVHHCRVESLTLRDLSLMTKDNDQEAEECKVDILISEWMGFYLLHESMLPSVLFARDHFLKQNEESMIFPRIAKLYASPCNLSAHYAKYITFWEDCYGFSFKPLQECAKQMRLQRPEIDCISDQQLLAQKQLIVKFDLKTMSLQDMQCIEKELFFIIDEVKQDTLLDGIAIWFDTVFTNKESKGFTVTYRNKADAEKAKAADVSMDKTKEVEFNKVVLSTSPSELQTHWKQTLIFLPERLKVKKDDVLGFQVGMKPSQENNRLFNIELNMLPNDHMQCQLLRCHMTAQ